MLSVAGEWVHEHNPKARLTLSGQELNDESYAICKADMLIKGQDVANIKPGDTLANDGHAHQVFDYFGATNRAIFERIAGQCVPRLSRALFIVVSNPVELAVKILSSAIDRERVIGMGAQQDSLRFARAIAVDLEISRHDVRASVLGEHGMGMIPLWRSVELMQDNPQAADRLADLRAKSAESPIEARVANLLSAVQQLVSMDRIAEAYELTRNALPDARIVVEPYITFHSLRSTPNATANATVQVIAAAAANDRRRIHGQVDVKGEVAGLHGVCGVPVTIGLDGWRPEPLHWLNPEEIRAIQKSTQSTEEFISKTLIDG
jgi:malate dehydrogenase